MRQVLRLAAAAGVGASALMTLGRPLPAAAETPAGPSSVWADPAAVPSSRKEQLAALRRGGFDLLVIGGGATGTGVALDAATRGLRTALVEAEDFAAGTSSRSTKLIHGGVRYLEKAVLQLDVGQLRLVFDALHERLHMLRAAPHLTNALPTIMPCYRLYEVPYFWAGLKAYDLVAGSSALTWSHYLTTSATRALFPGLLARRADGHQLCGSIVYYDGQMDDARLNVALATTAALAGATVLNYVRVVGLSKDTAGRVCGAVCRDELGGGEFSVPVKVVVNAAGPFCDGVRRLADGGSTAMITPSAGVHITLPASFCPPGHGLIVPRTADGRVVFLLPWLGAVLAGTTDAPAPLSMRPAPGADDVDFLLGAVGPYLENPPRRADVLSAWSGLRPLAADPNKKGGTENLTRDHVVAIEGGMVTVTGGKWTTYRAMAQEAVDAAVVSASLPAGQCVTSQLPLVGAHGWHPALAAELEATSALDAQAAAHLAASYGDRAPRVAALAAATGLRRPLAAGHSVLEAEVLWAARAEFCCTAADFLARRARLAFLDVAAARAAAPRVVQLLGDELGWSRKRRGEEQRRTEAFLATFEL